MKRVVLSLFFITLLISFQSCYYDKENILYPIENCDTSKAISYKTDIVPFFQKQCYGCHETGAGNITMGSYSTDKATIANGKLFGSISFASGFAPMPKGGSKVTNCQVSKIKKWIDAGSPNN